MDKIYVRGGTPLRGSIQVSGSKNASLAIMAPVGFIAIGAALVTRAHVRQFDQHARERTAQILARSVLGRDDLSIDITRAFVLARRA